MVGVVKNMVAKSKLKLEEELSQKIIEEKEDFECNIDVGK